MESEGACYISSMKDNTWKLIVMLLGPPSLRFSYETKFKSIQIAALQKGTFPTRFFRELFRVTVFGSSY